MSASTTRERARSPSASPVSSRRRRGRCGSTSPTAASAAPTCTSRTARWTPAFRAAGDRARDVRDRRRARRRRRQDSRPATPSSCVRSTPRRDAGRPRLQPHRPHLKFLGIDAPGALQDSWTVPAFTLHALPAGLDLRLAALAEPLAVACHDVRRGEVAAGQTAVVIGGGPHRNADRARRPCSRSARSSSSSRT